jgi:regulator of sigma E protease
MEEIYFKIISYAIPTVILLGILIFVHELGHFIVAKICGVRILKFSLGIGPKLFGKKFGETEYLLSWIPLGGYIKLLGEDPDEEIKEEEKAKSFTEKSVFKRFYIVVAGSLFNIFFAVVVFWAIYIAGVPTLLPIVGNVQDGFPAKEAGIKPGDKIVAIDGKKVSRWEELTYYIIESKGKSIDIEVLREGNKYHYHIEPKMTKATNLFNEEKERPMIGIGAKDEYKIVKNNPFVALQKSCAQTFFYIKIIIVTLVKLIQGQVPVKELGGPIKIAQIAGQTAQVGHLNFILFMAVLSINLGIINLFPIPILDGGHIFFLLIEFITRRPLSLKMREITQNVGLAILVILMAFVIFNDVNQVFFKKNVP